MELMVSEEMESIALWVVAGYCDAWRQVTEAQGEQGALWAGVQEKAASLGLCTDPSEQHLRWSIAAGLALHGAGFKGEAGEFVSAFLVAVEAIGLAEAGRAVTHV